MTNDELTRHLQHFPPDAEIYFPRTTTSGTIKSMRMGKSKTTKGCICLFTGYSHRPEEIIYPENLKLKPTSEEDKICQN